MSLAKVVDPLKADQGHLDRRPDPRREEHGEHGDGVFSLLEENARLRGLVVTLSTMILKFIVDQKCVNGTCPDTHPRAGPPRPENRGAEAMASSGLAEDC